LRDERTTSLGSIGPIRRCCCPIGSLEVNELELDIKNAVCFSRCTAASRRRWGALHPEIKPVGTREDNRDLPLKVAQEGCTELEVPDDEFFIGDECNHSATSLMISFERQQSVKVPCTTHEQECVVWMLRCHRMVAAQHLCVSFLWREGIIANARHKPAGSQKC
jgi:hypothetical protein